jgi:two-component system LytT family response regulator
MKKIIIPSQGNLRIVSHSDIIYCKSDNCYTNIFLDNGEQFIVCKSLKKIFSELGSEMFIRVNQSYLINKNYIKFIDKKSRQVELINNQRIPFTITSIHLYL